MSLGTCALVRARSPSMPRRHVHFAGSTIQGAASVNAPIRRSLGGGTAE
jgi:hypothetical protein